MKPESGTAIETSSGTPQATGVREVLRMLVKAQKALRLYLPGNAIAERLEESLASAMEAHIDEHGPLELAVRETALVWNGGTVYEAARRDDGLVRPMYRDGIRWISFLPGLTQGQIHGFLLCLNKVGSSAADTDDLVTLFWQHDFEAIRYVAIDELSSGGEKGRLEEQLASGAFDGGGAGGPGASGRSPDTVSIKDLKQPVAQLPVDACWMTEEEIEALRAEVAAEEAATTHLTVIELAVELVLHETDDGMRAQIGDHLAGILRGYLESGEPGKVSGCLQHLGGLVEALFHDSAPLGKLQERLLDALGQPAPLARFVETAESLGAPEPKGLTAYLTSLGPGAWPHLPPLLGKASTAAYRRAVSDVITAAGADALDPFARWLTSREQGIDADLLKEILHVLSRAPEEWAAPVLGRLLKSENETVRREAAHTLARFDTHLVDDLCLDLLQRNDPELRAAGLDTLVRHGRRDYALRLFERMLRDPGFAERSLAEKKLTCAAVSRIVGEEATEWFTEALRPQDRRWFASRRERETLQALAHGIRMIGTEKANGALSRLASCRNRPARTACRREIQEKSS